MAEDMVCCPKCSFKCVKSQLYKSRGDCPACKQATLSKAIKAEVE